MTDRSGAGPIELAVLAAIDTCGTGRPGRYAACSDVLSLIEERTGLGPRYAYNVLLDLARRWMIAVPVIEGNIGARQWPGDGHPQHIQCRGPVHPATRHTGRPEAGVVTCWLRLAE